MFECSGHGHDGSCPLLSQGSSKSSLDTNGDYTLDFTLMVIGWVLGLLTDKLICCLARKAKENASSPVKLQRK